MLIRERCRCPSRSRTTHVPRLSCPLSSSLPWLTGTASVRAGSLFRRPLLPAFSTWKTSGLTRSLENLGVNMPRSSTPALLTPIGFLSSASAFRNPHGVGLRASTPISGLYLAACSLAVYTSPGGSPHMQRNTRFQPGTTLCWIGFRPIGFSSISFRRCFLRLPPFQGFVSYRGRGEGLHQTSAAYVRHSGRDQDFKYSWLGLPREKREAKREERKEKTRETKSELFSPRFSLFSFLFSFPFSFPVFPPPTA